MQTIPLIIMHTASTEKIHSHLPMPASPPGLHLPSDQILINVKCFNRPQTTPTCENLSPTRPGTTKAGDAQLRTWELRPGHSGEKRNQSTLTGEGEMDYLGPDLA